jgi:hypothetical protein
VYAEVHWIQRELDDMGAARAALDLGIERHPKSALLYRFRQYLRAEMKDEAGAEEDRARADELSATS